MSDHFNSYLMNEVLIRLESESFFTLLPASRRCHTAPARNAALCPTLLPRRGGAHLPRTLLPESKRAAKFSDSAGSGVDTLWAVLFGAVPDPPGFRLGRRLTRALSAATQEMTSKVTNRHPTPPRAVRGRPKSGCTIAHHGTRHDHPCTPDDGAGVVRADADRAARGRGRHRSGRSPAGSGAAGTCRTTRPGPPR